MPAKIGKDRSGTLQLLKVVLTYCIVVDHIRNLYVTFLYEKPSWLFKGVLKERIFILA